MKVSPTTAFVIATLALVFGLGVAARDAVGADEAMPLPSDARAFGFLTHVTLPAQIPILRASRDFDLKLPNGVIRGATPNPHRLAWATALVTREMNRYPASFLKRVHLAGVVLTAELTENESTIPSLPNVAGLMLLDVTSTEADLVRTLHHEVFHFFDVADGQLASARVDERWKELNSPGFGYGSGGRTLRGAWAGTSTRELPGFVSAYATSAVEEDKAETFAFAVARTSFMRELCSADPRLRSKVEEIARRLARLDRATPSALALDTVADLHD